MEINFTTQNLLTTLPILLCLVGFVAYWFISESSAIKEKLKQKHGEENYTIHLVWLQKLAGLLFMGIVPGVFCLFAFPYSAKEYGLWLTNPADTVLWSLLLGGVAIAANVMIVSRKENLKHYPQIRAKQWTSATLVKNGVGWVLYLVGYEFLFRGILFFALLQVLDLWTVVAINIGMYSATHIPKGIAETLAAIPFGLIVCLVSYYTGNLYTALFVHICIALSNSYTAFYFHPEMKFIHNKPN